MAFGNIIVNWVIPFGGAAVLWILKKQSKNIGDIHILVNQRMTDMVENAKEAKKNSDELKVEVARLSRALADMSPHNLALSQQADAKAADVAGVRDSPPIEPG